MLLSSSTRTRQRLGAVLFSLQLITAAHADTDEIVYFHTDALGSPTAAFNEAGEVCWTETYSPYGEKLDNEDSLPPTEGCGLIDTADAAYTGHVQDGSGLVYAQQRYYDPQIGRFMSTDPVLPDMGGPRYFGRYQYAANSPYRYTDPDGMAYGDPNVEDDDWGDIDWGEVQESVEGGGDGYDWSSHESSGNWDSEKYKSNQYQDDLVTSKQRRAYWGARLSVQDPLAKEALDILDNKGLGKLANGLLQQAGVEDTQRFALGLMSIHHRNVKQDKTGIPGKLSQDQIDAYHNGLWGSQGLPGWTYGGNWPMSGLYYCSDCDD